MVNFLRCMQREQTASLDLGGGVENEFLNLLVIGQRLERVSDDCRRVLTTAALAGKVFRFDLLTRFPDSNEDDLLDALEEAVAASLVEDVSSDREARYAFVHEQIRQTLLSLRSKARRQRLHVRMADALESLYGSAPGAHAPDVAYHLYQAGAAADGTRTAQWLLIAAERGLAAVALEDAMRDLESARSVLRADDKESLVRILSLQARTLRGLARIDDALAALAEALTCSRRADMPARVSPVQSMAPALMRFSKIRLFTTLESKRWAKSSKEAKGPLASRSTIAFAIAAPPTFLIAARP